MSTAAELLLQRADDDRPGFRCEDRTWSYREIVAEARRRAGLFAELHTDGRPPHIGVLLENGPEYLFWLGAAALAGATVVGVNSTYRGAALGQLVTHSDCEVLVTSPAFAPFLEGLDLGLATDQVLVSGTPDYRARLGGAGAFEVAREPGEDTLFLLIFTSGTTGAPKAVRCTQGRFARTGGHVAAVAGLGPTDVVYSPLPFFHSSSLFTGWASALQAAVAFSSRPKFSASNTIVDIWRFRATMLTYTGKVLNYILATAERPDDADCPLRLAIGNEASPRDIKEFARRFGCTVRDSYGATEGIIIIRRDPSMPENALGTADPSVRVLDPETAEECPAATVGPDGKVTNLEAAVGEIVETAPTSGFEGYYKNEAATAARFRNGWYWSGDLPYRDAEGWLYFAGRSNEWLRVDGENFAVAPVEAILARHPEVRSVAVYAVPDDPVGDRVMAALELRQGALFDPEEFDRFLASQPDLGPKWVPSFVRVMTELPKLASMKLDKQLLRRQAWQVEEVFWRPERHGALHPLTPADRRRLDHLLG